MPALSRIQDWAADRGWCQYSLPRSRPRYSHAPDRLGLRLVVGTLGLFGVIVFGLMLIAMTVVVAAFVYAAVSP